MRNSTSEQLTQGGFYSRHAFTGFRQSAGTQRSSPGGPPVLDYFDRVRLSWAIIWPQIAFSVLTSIAMGIILFVSDPEVALRPTKEPPLIVTMMQLLFLVLGVVPWALQRAVKRSGVAAWMITDPDAPLTHRDWIAPAWMWLWRVGIINLFVGGIITTFILSDAARSGNLPSAVPLLVSVISLAISIFLVSPWIIVAMLQTHYATGIRFAARAVVGDAVVQNTDDLVPQAVRQFEVVFAPAADMGIPRGHGLAEWSSGRSEQSDPSPIRSKAPDTSLCTHERETSTYCTKCWTNLYELDTRG